jgi:prepilin-type N-terminal cleavage/methylation domain
MKREKENQQNRRRRSGFTLVELLLVVCILGILAAVVVPNIMGHDEEARRTATRTSIKTLAGQVQVFAMRHNGKLPDSLDELSQSTGDEQPLIDEGSLSDSWGTPFQYTKQGKKFQISSAGPDGEHGTEDDLYDKDLKK